MTPKAKTLILDLDHAATPEEFQAIALNISFCEDLTRAERAELTTALRRRALPFPGGQPSLSGSRPPVAAGAAAGKLLLTEASA